MSAPGTAPRALLHRCCASRRWVDAMLARSPWRDRDDLLRAAEESFRTLERGDWLEAFAGHPRIGDLEALRDRFGGRAGDPGAAGLAAGEQAGAAGAPEAVLRALAEGNARYQERFGYIFIVFASGKSAEEMLRLLERRLLNAPEDELPIAAGEQREITRKRLAEAADRILALGAAAAADRSREGSSAADEEGGR